MHIYGRARKSTRWSMDNSVAGCYACHQHFTSHPLEFTRFLEGYLGQGHLDLLREKANSPMRTNKALRAEIAKHYREEFKAWEADNSYRMESYN